jgi:mannosyltransferase OCH1-like enzyme
MTRYTPGRKRTCIKPAKGKPPFRQSQLPPLKPLVDNSIVLPGEFIVTRDFEGMMRRSYAFDKKIYDNDPRWAISKNLYDSNFLYKKDRQFNKIPKIIHQIWIGGGLPYVFKKYAETWQKINPDWEYKLWTDKDIALLDLPNRKLYDSMTNPGPKSDLLRYHLLDTYGGLYVDTDFECIKPFNDLTYLDFFTGIAYAKDMELYPGLVGAIPNHPITKKIIQEVNKINYIPESPIGVLETISCYFFTRVFWSVVSKYQEGIVTFPPDYFYPFPNQRGHNRRSGIEYVKDCSYAVHHWSVSWQK